jgi:hypothetical protein
MTPAKRRSSREITIWLPFAGTSTHPVETTLFFPVITAFNLTRRFKEKGGKEKELPVHHKLEELLDQYLKSSGLEKWFPISCPSAKALRAISECATTLGPIMKNVTYNLDLGVGIDYRANCSCLVKRFALES